jgi:RNA-directed DNA polymerase
LRPGDGNREVYHIFCNIVGGVTSPVLANLALDGLEAAVLGQFPERLRRQRQIHLVRFADDFVVFGRNKELLETDINPELNPSWPNVA